MTAEIAILNRHAVALAADSAVTIRTASGAKIYNSVNKVFALLKRRPVGVMIYSVPDLLGMPWETIIKAYRLMNPAAGFNRLEDYVDHFLEFVETDRNLLSIEAQDGFYLDFANSLLEEVAVQIGQAVHGALSPEENETAQDEGSSSDHGLDDAAIQEIADRVIAASIETVEDREDAPWAGRMDIGVLMSDHEADTNNLITRIFEKLPLTDDNRLTLRRLVAVALTKVQDEAGTGLVIAGFGDREYFPHLVEYHIAGAVDGVLRARRKASHDIDLTTKSQVVPFAQRNDVDTFLSGIDPGTEDLITKQWGLIESVYPRTTVEQLDRLGVPLSATQRDQLIAALASLGHGVKQRFTEQLNRYVQEQNIDPILSSVEFLPKDELALMAESLVNITKLKRKVSIHSTESVGGEIDVAVVSRGDGFVWVKRKHYFPNDLNPTWAPTHAGNDPHRVEGEG